MLTTLPQFDLLTTTYLCLGFAFIGFTLGSYVKFKDIQKKYENGPTDFDRLIAKDEIEKKVVLIPAQVITPTLTDQTLNQRAIDPKDLNVRLGAIKRPSEEELERRRNPERAGEEDAMRETLKGIPELNQPTEPEMANPITATNDPLLDPEEIEAVRSTQGVS